MCWPLKGLLILFVLPGFAAVQATAQAAVQAAFTQSGYPGCFQLIRNQSLRADEVKSLPANCVQWRNDYFWALEKLEKDPEVVFKQMSLQISQAKKAQAPYRAILFASLLENKTLPPAVEKALNVRAQTEARLKVPYAYATAALLKLKNGDCEAEPRFKHELYQEICRAHDSIVVQLLSTRGQL